MRPIDFDQQRLSSFSSPAPFGFGQHPKFERSFKARRSHVHRYAQDLQKGRLDEAILGKKISLSELVNPCHPEVVVIPRNRFLYIVDVWGDAIGFEQTVFPFSSTDFYVDTDMKGLFYEFGHSEAFFRLGEITQLGYLVPPRPEEWDKNISIAYTIPQFSHTRWIHSLLVAILMDLILARNGFSEKERAPVVLAAGSHDIAIPAGGDSIKRVDPENLREEKNFAWVLKHYGLAKRWAERFDFDLASAQNWVKGKGAFGKLLDAIDKICYTALDCYYLGLMRPGKVRELCLKYPLVMDVWQDIQFSPDHTNFAFSQPENLFRFLLLRAYEFQELLYNPYSRTLDFLLKRLVQPFYRKGYITKEQLLTHGDKWLEETIAEMHPIFKSYVEPEELSWKKFETAETQREFCAELGEKVDHTEHITGFSTGLDWLVFDQGKTVQLGDAISRDKIELLEGVVASTRGYYVYFRS